MEPGRWVVTALLLGLLPGCAAASEAPSTAPEPRVELAFTQLLPDEGTRRALLRVGNLSEEPLTVTAAGLDWPGYGAAFTVPQDATVEGGRTLDLRILLPVAECGADAPLEEPVRGVLRTSGGEVVQPLTGPGQVFVQRLHDTWCGSRLLAENVSVEYADDWRVAPDVRDGEPAAVGSLVLTRQQGTEPVMVTAAQGTVLYDLGVRTPVSVPPDRPRVTLAAAVLPGNRCDEHARGQATAPWTLALSFRVGEGDAVRATRTIVEPPAQVRRLATTALDRACVLRR